MHAIVLEMQQFQFRPNVTELSLGQHDTLVWEYQTERKRSHLFLICDLIGPNHDSRIGSNYKATISEVSPRLCANIQQALGQNEGSTKTQEFNRSFPNRCRDRGWVEAARFKWTRKNMIHTDSEAARSHRWKYGSLSAYLSASIPATTSWLGNPEQSTWWSCNAWSHLKFQ